MFFLLKRGLPIGLALLSTTVFCLPVLAQAEAEAQDDPRPVRLQAPHALGARLGFPDLVALQYRYQIDENWAAGGMLSPIGGEAGFWSPAQIGLTGRYYFSPDSFSSYVEINPTYHGGGFIIYQPAPYYALYGRYGIEGRAKHFSVGAFAGLGLAWLARNRELWGVLSLGAEASWHF